MELYLRLITFCACFTFLQTQLCKKEKRCQVSRIYRMKGADCVDKNMREFPQCISGDVEIIDASYNRIRKLGKDDLKRYSNLKMLYLSDNAIMIIDEEAFDGKDELTTLDLRLNSLSKLPPVVFHLPSLNTLYLGQNMNINIVEVVQKAKPITSPLVQLDISYVMTEEQSELPEFGTLPFLTKYNISGNKLMSVTTKHFAGLCSLKILDTNNVTVEYEKPCDCWTLNRWLRSRNVEFKPFFCERKEKDCMDEVPKNDLQIYNKCSEDREIFNKKSRMLKGVYISIGVIVLIVIPIVLISLYVMRKRKLRKREQLNNEQLHNEHMVPLNNKL